MSEKKGWGGTVLGWFVTREGGEGEAHSDGNPADADALIARYAQEPSTPAAPPPVELKGRVELPSDPGAALDFASVFRAAGIADAEQERVGKARSLLAALPADMSRDVKRSIVEPSLKAFGVPVEQIIEAGAQQIQALQAYIEIGVVDRQKLVAEAQTRIASLEKEIADVKALVERKAAAQEQLEKSCNQEKLRVQEVLEFFGQEAVARVVRDSPKLVEPTQK